MYLIYSIYIKSKPKCSQIKQCSKLWLPLKEEMTERVYKGSWVAINILLQKYYISKLSSIYTAVFMFKIFAKFH